MDGSLVAAVVSATGGIVTVGGTVITAWRSAKNREERDALRTVDERTAEKLQAERDQIAERTTGMVLAEVRVELERVKKELAAAKQELEVADDRANKYREALMEKNDQIYLQDLEIRRMQRRSRALEDWVDANLARFQELGIDGLPDDLLDDRRRRQGE